MAKITKERVEKCLNELTSLVKDMIGQVDLFENYNASEILKHFNELRSSCQYLAEGILNKDKEDMVQPVAQIQRIRIELKKSLPENLAAAKLQAAAEEMSECLPTKKK